MCEWGGGGGGGVLHGDRLVILVVKDILPYTIFTMRISNNTLMAQKRLELLLIKKLYTPIAQDTIYE